MSQSMSQMISQVMRQEQRLTPQLIQSMDILQLPLIALEQRINEELEQNPVLEYEPVQAKPAGEQAAAGDAPDNADAQPDTHDPIDTLESIVDRGRFAGDNVEYRRRTGGDGEADPKVEAMANTAARPQSLQEYLLDQWRFVEADPQIKRAGEAIINFIEDDGYLRTNFEMIGEAMRSTVDRKALEQALYLVQKLDPPGIAARDLPECLLLQLQALYPEEKLAGQIVRCCLSDVAKKRLPAIAKVTGASVADVKAAVDIIARLQMRPGSALTNRPVARIVPDVLVDYDEESQQYRVRLAKGNNPRLRLSPYYLEMYRQNGVDRATREFLRKKIEAARAIQDAIEYRRQRLLQVSKTVVDRQRAFFEYGPEHLKILRMCDLAAEFGCDPSTISRTVDDKYMQTPRGIFPLRYFFTGGMQTTQGDPLSWDAVKARVQQIIETEGKNQPLSDEQIAKMLQDEGIDVSRRTVAKYRAQLNIPPARQRKDFEYPPPDRY
jgi:RNA polymerase sigma-54 factor